METGGISLWSRKFCSFQVDVSLMTDIAIKWPQTIRFDALLQKLMMDNDPVKYTQIITDYELPLRKIFLGDKWFWDCSNAIIPDLQYRTMDTIKKRITTNGIHRKNLNISNGMYTSNIYSFERIQTSLVRFFVYGDLDLVKDILSSNLTHLGGLRKDGFGLVEKVVVSRIEKQQCFLDGNTLLRDIPIVGDMFSLMGVQGLNLRYGRFRPPYNPGEGFEQSLVLAQGSIVHDKTLLSNLRWS